MASTSVTTVGGVVIVTQVIPKDENSIPLKTPANHASQAPPPATKPSPTKMDDITTTFLRGEPLGLGVVQIFIGLLCVLFSLTVVYSWALMVYIPFCLGAAFVFSGSLAVAVARRTSASRVWASLVSHVVSVSLGLAGVAYICWLLADGRPSALVCSSEAFWKFSNADELRSSCSSNLWMLDITLYGVLGLLLVLLVLQVCVAITVCVFSGRAIKRHSHYSPIMSEANDHSTLLSAAASGHDSDTSLLDNDDEDCLRTALP